MTTHDDALHTVEMKNTSCIQRYYEEPSSASAQVVVPASGKSSLYAFLVGCLAGAAAAVTAAIVLDGEPVRRCTDAVDESNTDALEADAPAQI